VSGSDSLLFRQVKYFRLDVREDKAVAKHYLSAEELPENIDPRAYDADQNDLGVIFRSNGLRATDIEMNDLGSVKYGFCQRFKVRYDLGANSTPRLERDFFLMLCPNWHKHWIDLDGYVPALKISPLDIKR
jgi:hypothetical protein